MRCLLILTVGLCLLITAVPVMADQAADEMAIRAATKKSIETVNKRDIEAHLDLYTDSYFGLTWEMDPAAHRKVHTDRWERMKDLQLELLDEIDVVFLSPNIAVHRYRQQYTGWIDENGKPTRPGTFPMAMTYVKKNGKWFVAAQFQGAMED